MIKPLPYETDPEKRGGAGSVSAARATTHSPGRSKVFLCAFVAVFFALAVPAAGQTPAKVEDKASREKTSLRALSPAEKQWLETHRTLRVGFFDRYMPYSGTDKDGQVTGIVKDLFPDILARLGLSNLKITYTGFASYDAMIADLKAGKIDVAFPVGGRASIVKGGDISRSDPVTSTSTVLVYKGTFTERTMAHFAINKDNRMQRNFIIRQFPNAKVTKYPSIDACLDAVVSGEVSCTTLNGMRANYILKNRRYRNLFLQQLDRNDDRYCGVKSGNEGLAMLLNRGLDALGKDYAHNKSHRYTYASSAYESEAEKQWLRSHDTLRVGFFENYMPYSGTDKDGQVTGIVKDLFPDILARLGLSNLKITYTGFASYDAMIADLKAGKIDVAFPVGGRASIVKGGDISRSDPVTSTSTVLVYKGTYSERTMAHFAINKDNRMQRNYIVKLFPNAKVTEYPSIDACLDAVNSGKVSCTTLNGLRANYMLKNRRYKGLSLHQLGKTDDRHFGVGSGNEGLAMLLNRGLDALGKDYAYNKSQRYIYALSADTNAPLRYRLVDVLRDHLWLFGALLFAVAAVIIALLARDIRRTRRRMAEKEAASTSLEKTNRKLLEHARTIEKQRKQEAELRKELEKKQAELDAAYNEKTTALTDLEDASGLARLASFHYDFDTRVRTGSKLVRELWPEDENGRALLEEEFVYPEDIPVFKQNVKALLEKKSETVQFSFRVGTSPDELRHYRMKLSPDPHKPKAVTGIVQDVTELAESMLKLKDTQALWNTAINSIPVMFTVKDIDDDFRYFMCNKAFAKFFDLPPDEIVGKTDRELFHDDSIIGFADRINIPTTGSDGLMEIAGEVPDGDGDLRYVKTIMRVFKDARGHRLLLAAANDVTDMHRLLQNRGVINKLLEEIIGENDFDLSIQRTLETVCKILGASRGCLIRHEEAGTKAHCVAEYVEPTHAHASFRMLDRTLSRVRGVLENTVDQRTFVCDDIASFDWKNSNEEWHRAALALDLRAIFLSNIVCDGEVRGTVGFNFEGVDHTFSDNDVSLLRVTAHIIEVILSRKHAQTLIMDALAHAQAADKAKSFFIASVSHEIRTPLNSVIGFAELLREGGVSQKQAKEYLDAISTSANALLMLINDVLDLSKLEANQMQIVTAFTDLNALCREVMLIFTFRARENGNKLVSEVPDDLPELDVDNIRIRQILINLFGNAVKFTKDGTITLRVTFTPDPGSADTGTLRCAVTDTGIGISEENQKKLMEPFVQLPGLRGTNAVNNGTGLGLSISKRLAVCMNGELTCTSKEGMGSTFAVTLRSVRYRAKTAPVKLLTDSGPAVAAPARDAKAIRILIVDDVKLNLRVAKALFERIGFDDVLTADSGKAALELLGRQPVDLILSDIWMPEMNGSEFSAEVKKDPRFAHIPIVAQTADVETNGNFDMSHFDAVIQKPLTKEKLSNMIKRIVEEGGLRKGDGGAPVNLG